MSSFGGFFLGAVWGRGAGWGERAGAGGFASGAGAGALVDTGRSEETRL